MGGHGRTVWSLTPCARKTPTHTVSTNSTNQHDGDSKVPCALSCQEEGLVPAGHHRGSAERQTVTAKGRVLHSTPGTRGSTVAMGL